MSTKIKKSVLPNITFVLNYFQKMGLFVWLEWGLKFFSL